MVNVRVVAALAGCVLTAAGLAAPAGGAVSVEGNESRAHGCAWKFDRAQRVDMESFRDFDAETWREGHDPEAISIYPTGEMYRGIDEIMSALEGHFTNKNAVWTWTELSRRVDGCKTAVIVYDATYDIPEHHYHQRALTVVTYVYDHGRWRSVMDQGTLLELTNG